MSQIVFLGNGGGGGGDVTGLTPDSGGQVTAVLGNINVFGEQAYTNPVVDTVNVGNNLFVEDRTWVTPYVVDAITTIGERGTFSTIQSAINKAVTDGRTSALILVRAGEYVEDIVLPAGIALSIVATEVDGFTGNIINPNFVIDGEMTVAVNAYGHQIKGFLIQNTSDPTSCVNFLNSNIVTFFQCYFLGDVNIASAVETNFENCIWDDIINLNLSNSEGVILLNCQHFGQININTGLLIMNGSNANNAPHIDIVNAELQAINSTIGLLTGTSDPDTTTITLTNCLITANSQAVEAEMIWNNCSFPDQYSVPTSTIVSGDSFSGNYYNRIEVDDDYVFTGVERYVAVTDTSAPISIEMIDFPGGANSRGRTYIIADESGGAGTNPITITADNGGPVTINGLASVQLDKDYQMGTFTWTGTEVIATFSSVDASSPYFSAVQSGAVANVTGDGTNYNLIFDVEFADQGSNYNTSTGLFTAPTTGNYFFTASMLLTNLNITHNYAAFGFLYNGVYYFPIGTVNPFTSTNAFGQISYSVTLGIPMTAGTTINVVAQVQNGTKTVGIFGDTGTPTTLFSGFRVA